MSALLLYRTRFDAMYHKRPLAALFDHLVGVGKRLARARNRSSAREMLNARWQCCPSAHLLLPDRRHRGREIPVVEAPNRRVQPTVEPQAGHKNDRYRESLLPQGGGSERAGGKHHVRAQFN